MERYFFLCYNWISKKYTYTIFVRVLFFNSFTMPAPKKAAKKAKKAAPKKAVKKAVAKKAPAKKTVKKAAKKK